MAYIIGGMTCKNNLVENTQGNLEGFGDGSIRLRIYSTMHSLIGSLIDERPVSEPLQ